MAAGECLLLGAAWSLPVLVLLRWGLSVSSLWFWIALPVAAVAVGAAIAWRRGWLGTGLTDLAYYLNRRYPALEDSADLLLQDPEILSPLARLQHDRIAERLSGMKLSLPHRFPYLLMTVVASLVVSGGLAWLLPPAGDGLPLVRPAGNTNANEKSSPSSFDSTPELSEYSLVIRPPAYTRLRPSEQQTFDLEVPAGSTIRWQLAFDPAITAGKLITGDGQSLPLRERDGGDYSVSFQADRTTFYQLTFQGADGNEITSQYYQLRALPDQPPGIEVDGLPQFAEYPYDPEKTIRFSTLFSDDYGISGARLIATVSSGEGESVKFRDDTLSFNASFRQEAKSYRLDKVLRLGDLGMAPGDELYLHLEAIDNRRPESQITKTFKYIIAFENPEALAVDMSGGLAVDRLPEYFRSQRQIIIDTEKLIAREKELDEKAFGEQSNNIAIDQKLLRLRYGRFLGEEFQTVIGEVPLAESEEDHEHSEEDEDHDHDAHDHDQESEHEHEPTASEDGEIAELEPYYHVHDITEEVTFFDAATAAKLRAALAQMWDAELHLRMGRPRQALPFEYKALKLIKEIQQASRIYVERVGFEPPAIKVAEKRLTGELDAIGSPVVQRPAAGEEAFPAIAAALPILEVLRRARRPPLPSEYSRLQAAGEELATLALEQPGAYLKALQQLRSVMEYTEAPERLATYLDELMVVFWQLLPDQEQQPLRVNTREGKLRDLFLQEIRQSE